MKLADYLRSVDKSPEAFGREIGVARVSVARYVLGSRRPTWPIMMRIIKVTGGRVTANDFLEIETGRRGVEKVA